MRPSTIALFLLACATRGPNPVGSPDVVEPTEARKITQTKPWVAMDNLRSLSCEGGECVVVLDEKAWRFDAEKMALNEPIEPPKAHAITALSSTETPVEDAWNQVIQNRWRSPFASRVPTPEGGRLSFVRGLGVAGAQVVRSGGGIRTRPAPSSTAPIAYPRRLAVHQTGHQAYLIAWPHPEIIAFDPRTLKTAWRADMDAPVVGLFVDRTGRYLVVETGGEAPAHQLLDYPTEPPKSPPDVDPYADRYWPSIPRPTARHTVVLDVNTVEIAMDMPGSFRALIGTQEAGTLLATTRGVGKLP
jgi:hypothetical protein